MIFIFLVQRVKWIAICIKRDKIFLNGKTLFKEFEINLPKNKIYISVHEYLLLKRNTETTVTGIFNLVDIEILFILNY